jgi:hypothetical protein
MFHWYLKKICVLFLLSSMHVTESMLLISLYISSVAFLIVSVVVNTESGVLKSSPVLVNVTILFFCSIYFYLIYFETGLFFFFFLVCTPNEIWPPMKF